LFQSSLQTHVAYNVTRVPVGEHLLEGTFFGLEELAIWSSLAVGQLSTNFGEQHYTPTPISIKRQSNWYPRVNTLLSNLPNILWRTRPVFGGKQLAIELSNLIVVHPVSLLKLFYTRGWCRRDMAKIEVRRTHVV
jgi:hypothetical protein